MDIKLSDSLRAGAQIKVLRVDNRRAPSRALGNSAGIDAAASAHSLAGTHLGSDGSLGRLLVVGTEESREEVGEERHLESSCRIDDGMMIVRLVVVRRLGTVVRRPRGVWKKSRLDCPKTKRGVVRRREIESRDKVGCCPKT